MLEAIQLLVKTKLFVVVLALDSRYVTLSSEDNYKGILPRDGTPSGMDYLEKIVQLPYRIPPPDDTVMGEYLRVQLGQATVSKKRGEEQVDDAGQRRTSTQANRPSLHQDQKEGFERNNNDAESNANEEQEDSRSQQEGAVDEDNDDVASTNSAEVKQTPAAALNPYMPTERLTLVESDFELELKTLTEACLAADVTPRAAKRLANVFNLMKIIWHNREKAKQEPTGKNDSDDRQRKKEEHVRLACLVLLALSASRRPGMRTAMELVLTNIETAIHVSKQLVSCKSL